MTPRKYDRSFRPSALKGDITGAQTKMSAYVGVCPDQIDVRREDEAFDACNAHLSDLREAHPGESYRSFRIGSEGAVVIPTRAVRPASYCGSPAAMCAGN